jgi:hypothetical protein
MSEQTIQFLLNNGVAVLVLVATGWGIYMLAQTAIKGVSHAFEHVVIPVKDAALSHLESTNEHLKKTSEAIEGLQCTLEKIDRKLPPDRT